jgi:hypothetical protein
LNTEISCFYFSICKIRGKTTSAHLSEVCPAHGITPNPSACSSQE